MRKIYNNRMQPDFGELALSSAADVRRYVDEWIVVVN